MIHKSLLASALVLSTLASPPDPPPQKSAFARIASLAGDWALVDSEGEATGIRATYMVIAGGAAVMETLLADTPDETVTVYHRERARVTATHLTARGNPVRLTPAAAPGSDALRFKADRGETKPGLLSALVVTPLDKEHLRIQWSLASGREEHDTRTFELRRHGPAEELAGEIARLRVNLESLQRELDRRLKREITVKRKGEPDRVLLETRTLPPGPGWDVSGVPFRLALHAGTMRYASTFASAGDRGMTVGHYGFVAGPGCRARFSVLGGHAYIAIVEETKAPPRRIRSIPDFSVDLLAGEYGTTIERVVGKRWKDYPATIEWDLSQFTGKPLRLYVVDAETNHYGQISISEVSILEDAE